jgi:iron complex transport system substrate-binding protein
MIGERLGELEIAMETVKARPRVALLEWLQPFYVGGHWVPKMIERAGGEDVFGRARTPSFRVSVEEVIEAAPDVLLIAPCGYGKEQARDEYLSLQLPAGWNGIPAVQEGRVYKESSTLFLRRKVSAPQV